MMNLIAALVGHSQEFPLHMFSSTYIGYMATTLDFLLTRFFFTWHYKMQYNTDGERWQQGKI